MPRKKILKNPEEVVEMDKIEAVVPVETDKVEEGASVSVYHKDVFVRTYSAAMHGNEYRKLAEQFISDRPGYILK